MLKRLIINKHPPKAKKPQNMDQFAYFLAGLIDGDGSIDKKGNFILCFHSRDLSVAYYVKKIIGHGHVRKIKNKKAWIYNCTNKAGNIKIANLIFNKIRHPSRILRLNTIMLNIYQKPIECGDTKIFDLNTHWLAGFIQADGSFQVKILENRCKLNTETRLVIQVDQKTNFLLLLIQDHLGGYIGYRANQDTYYYSSVSFHNCVLWMRYLDKFQVMGSSLTLYWMWRKCYLVVQEKKHINNIGLEKIKKIKRQMRLLRNPEFDIIS